VSIKDRETYQKLGICLAVALGELILVSALFGGGAGLIPFWLAFGLKYVVIVLAPGVSVKAKAFNRTIYTFLVIDILLSMLLLTGGYFVIIGYALLSSSMLCYLMAAVSCFVIYVAYKAFESLEPKPKVAVRPKAKPKAKAKAKKKAKK
jgi:hypothetical protein